MPIKGPTTDPIEIKAWAKQNRAVPVEVLPSGVDASPAVLRIMLASQVSDRREVREIGWEDFFAKFDALGLAFVYDSDDGYNELLQQEERSPYRIPAYNEPPLAN